MSDTCRGLSAAELAGVASRRRGEGPARSCRSCWARWAPRPGEIPAPRHATPRRAASLTRRGAGRGGPRPGSRWPGGRQGGRKAKERPTPKCKGGVAVWGPASPRDAAPMDKPMMDTSHRQRTVLKVRPASGGTRRTGGGEQSRETLIRISRDFDRRLSSVGGPRHYR